MDKEKQKQTAKTLKMTFNQYIAEKKFSEVKLTFKDYLQIDFQNK
jgi:hypothetical protein